MPAHMDTNTEIQRVEVSKIPGKQYKLLHKRNMV
jgi:hypothetical protein